MNTIMLAKKMNLTKEMYLAIMLDRASMGNHKPAPTLNRTLTLTLTQTLTLALTLTLTRTPTRCARTTSR